MNVLMTVGGIALLLIVLGDAYEAILLPRTTRRRLRLARLFYRAAWWAWTHAARLFSRRDRRLMFLEYFGALSLILLLAVWAIGLITGFALLHWGMGTRLDSAGQPVTGPSLLYFSGVTFFTLGFGDITPLDPLGRVVTVIEAGLGFGFFAVVIGYLPVFYQAFAQRETAIVMLDERAGSPPSAGTLLLRCGQHDGAAHITSFLASWEQWAAAQLGSHLSYPLLCFFRSQHDDQSWLAALTMVLDTCALVQVGIAGVPQHQARLTFAMARHAVVDLSQIFLGDHKPPLIARPAPSLEQLRDRLASVGLTLDASPQASERFEELRAMYEPYVAALAEYLLFELPPWLPEDNAPDSWQRTEHHVAAQR